MSGLIAAAVQAATLFSDSLALPIPEGAEIAARCNTPLLERLGVEEDEVGERCLSFQMEDFPVVMSALEAAMVERGWSLASEENNVRIFSNNSPPPDCTQGLVIMPAPPDRGMRGSTDPELRPWDGAGLVVLLPMMSEPACDFT